MKNNKIIPGVVLILIGAVVLLHNYGVIAFHWGNFFYLWPIFIVIGGINLIFANNRSTWATVVKLGVIIAGFALVVFGNFGKHNAVWDGSALIYNDDNNDDDDADTTSTGKVTKVEGNSVFNEPFVADAKVARLNISGGGTVYQLSDTTNQLFNAETKEFRGHYVYSSKKEDSVYVLNFNMKGNHGFHFDLDDKRDRGYGKNNSVIFKLNPNPEWELDIKTGATKLDFDLSKFKVRSLKLSGGAADFDVKLGQPLTETNVNVSTGMSSTTISIPANAACRINSSTGLSSTNFEGFTKNNDGVYETPGFANATHKIFIKMSGGMADFKVKRY
jgi:hypothetical protein